MGLLTFLAVAVFSFGPSFALFFAVVARRSQLVIVAVTSAFFCLIGLMVSGFFWVMIEPLQDNVGGAVILGVVCIESVRFAFLKVYERGDAQVKKLTANPSMTPFSDFASAVSSGLGFAMMYALVMYGGILQASFEPADLFTEACPDLSGFAVSAILALLYQVFNVALMVLMLDALRKADNPHNMYARLFFVLLIHLAASLLGLINSNASAGGCKVGIPLQSLVILGTVAEAYRATRLPDYGVMPQGRVHA